MSVVTLTGRTAIAIDSEHRASSSCGFVRSDPPSCYTRTIATVHGTKWRDGSRRSGVVDSVDSEVSEVYYILSGGGTLVANDLSFDRMRAIELMTTGPAGVLGPRLFSGCRTTGHPPASLAGAARIGDGGVQRDRQ